MEKASEGFQLFNSIIAIAPFAYTKRQNQKAIGRVQLLRRDSQQAGWSIAT